MWFRSRCSARRSDSPSRYLSSAASTSSRALRRSEDHRSRRPRSRAVAGRSRVMRKTNRYQPPISTSSPMPTMSTHGAKDIGSTGSLTSAAWMERGAGAQNTFLPPQQVDQLVDQLILTLGDHTLHTLTAQHRLHI